MSEAKKIVLFVAATIAAFVYICTAVPQLKSEPVTESTTEIGESPEALVAAGRSIFMSDRAQCLTCHSLGEDPKARCPNQEGLGERAPSRKPGYSAAQYLVESVYNPNAFVVPGYPSNQMTPVNRPPIALPDDEILAVIAFLNTLGSDTDATFIDEVKAAQDPWRRGILKPEVGVERARLPIFAGDPAGGHKVLEEQNCLRCHRIGAEGKEGGPELTAIGASQSPEYILESILDPSAVIVKGYKQINVIWQEPGRVLLRGVPLAWIPNQETPRSLRLSVDENGEIREREIDLSQVEVVGDTIVGTRIDGKFKRYCGQYVAGDQETGLTLKVLQGGRWIEERIPAEVIQFVNPPASPMPANFAELLTPKDVYDLLAFLVEQKGQP
ncbi:MAG: hypothetical protein ACE5HV_02595 [Acidobacteriota bacterium]